jgi:hypothetical protein
MVQVRSEMRPGRKEGTKCGASIRETLEHGPDVAGDGLEINPASASASASCPINNKPYRERNAATAQTPPLNLTHATQDAGPRRPRRRARIRFHRQEATLGL